MQDTSSPTHPSPAVSAPSAANRLDAEMRSLCAQLADGRCDRATFLERCARLTNATVGCSRTGIWMFVDTAEGRILRCLAMYDAVNRRMAHVPDETNEVGAYFKALEEDGYVVASDAHEHPATAGFFAQRLGARGVRSLLASSFSVNGQVFGAFTCTQVGEKMAWSAKQLAALRLIGGPASLALFKESRFTPDTGLGPLV